MAAKVGILFTCDVAECAEAAFIPAPAVGPHEDGTYVRHAVTPSGWLVENSALDAVQAIGERRFACPKHAPFPPKVAPVIEESAPAAEAEASTSAAADATQPALAS